MGGLFAVESYFPDRPPTWADVLIGVFGSMVIGGLLLSPSVLSLPALALGFVGTAILLGPVAQTRVGKQIDEWWTEIGVLGRAAVIALFWIGVIVMFGFEAIPRLFIQNVGYGCILFVCLVLAAHILRERQVEGWILEWS